MEDAVTLCSDHTTHLLLGGCTFLQNTSELQTQTYGSSMWESYVTETSKNTESNVPYLIPPGDC